MACPRCGRKSKRVFKGYCSEVHYRLSEDKVSDWVRLNCAVCGIPITRRPSRVPKKGNPVCARCSKNQGENHWNFKGARFINPSGYVNILVNNHYVLEHRYRWQRANRATILSWQPVHIHHINFDKQYNDPKNLLILFAHEHSRVHQYLRLGRQKEAYEIMHKRALEQYYYPSEVDKFKPKVKSKRSSTKERKSG